MEFHKNDIASLRANHNGAIFYVCSFAHPSEPPETKFAAEAPPVDMASGPLSSPPIYHSKPGSQNVVFLDFDGHVVTNTSWNTSKGVSRWDCLPFSTDADRTTFSDLEQRCIYEIWQRVAEDYAPFDIDVTTEQPPMWNRWIAHALITSATDANGTQCPHYNTGGVAYVDVFNDPLFSYNAAGCYSPAWVAIQSGNSYASTAEATSHEIGHNMGLSHDGTLSGVEYYGGHWATASAPSWGPIMGTDNARNLSQWSKGEYYNANLTQDDLAIIAAKAAYRPDDHGNTHDTATDMTQAGLQISASGIIERTGEVDVFKFSTGAGTINLSLQPLQVPNGTWGGNADLALLLYDSSNTLLASNNPAAEVVASVSVSVQASTYYANVKPVAAGIPLNNPPSGNTVYGSIGAYELSGTVIDPGLLISSIVATNHTELRVEFNRQVSTATAGDIGNYTLNGDLMVFSAAPGTDGQSANLRVTYMETGSVYQLLVEGVEDSLGNSGVCSRNFGCFPGVSVEMFAEEVACHDFNAPYSANTNITTGVAGTIGLKNIANGYTLANMKIGGSAMSASSAGTAAIGGDAYNIFSGYVDSAGSGTIPSQGTSVLTFTNLLAARSYSVAAYAGKTGGKNQPITFQIGGVDSTNDYLNTSSAGGTIGTTILAKDTYGLETKGNATRVAQYEQVNPGSDGSFTLMLKAVSSETYINCLQFIAGAYAKADATAPAAVSALAITPARLSNVLSWKNPGETDYQGVLILRRTGSAPTAAPANGTIYQAGHTLGDSVVVHMTPGTNRTVNGVSRYVDSGLSTGLTYFYAVFAVDAMPNYSEGVVAEGLVAEGLFAEDGDSDHDGLPDWWEELHYGSTTGANPTAFCSNGVNTLSQAYIAGLVPTDPFDLFQLSLQPSPSANVLLWRGVSGRVYNVCWSSNLLDGFQVLKSDVLWNNNVFTDAVHGVANGGFYKIEVELE